MIAGSCRPWQKSACLMVLIDDTRVKLAKLLSRLSAQPVRRTGVGEQVAFVGGVNENLSAKFSYLACVAI